MSDQFKIGELFNSETIRGRANVAKVTLASVSLIYMFVRIHRRNVQRRESKLYCKSCLKKLMNM